MVDGPSFLAGVSLLLFGAWSAAKPRAWANFGEQLDAIGSRREGTEVEAAEWNVQLTRYSGYVFVLLGLFVAVFAVR